MLDALIEKLADICLTDTDIDAILDMREQEPFDRAWMNAYNEVERLKQENGFSASQIKISDDYRKQAYLKAYSLFQSSDIAAYISDDFGLIADSEQFQYESLCISKLMQSYMSSIIPCGNL